uniref:Hydrolase_4 domain-containing protein n=1 Tax=Panagrellus redivivus TaxID=6233 RepID=A0A7E4ZQ94_PANRE
MEAQEPQNNQPAVLTEAEPLNPQPADGPEAEHLSNVAEGEKPFLTRVTDAVRRCFNRVRPVIPFETVQRYVFKPPEPTYTLRYDNGRRRKLLELRRPTEGISQEDLYDIYVEEALNQLTNLSICTIFWPCPNSTYTLVVSHDSAVDIGSDLVFTKRLRNQLQCNVFTYDYSGYGCSGGRPELPSETNLYADARTAFSVLHGRVDPNKIIFFGQSVGTAPSIHLAMDDYAYGGLILQSPFTSYMASRHWYWTPFMDYDFLHCADKIKRVACSTAVIHSTRDKVLSYRNAKKMAKNAPQLRFWILSIADHNTLNNQDCDNLREFIYNRSGSWAEPSTINGG